MGCVEAPGQQRNLGSNSKIGALRLCPVHSSTSTHTLNKCDVLDKSYNHCRPQTHCCCCCCCSQPPQIKAPPPSSTTRAVCIAHLHMAFSSSLAAWPSSSCCSTSRSRCARNRTAAPSQPVAGIAALPRRQHNISISADLQQHSLGQHLPALAAPKQQQPHWCMQQQQQQLQSNSQQSRCAVVAGEWCLLNTLFEVQQ